MSSSEETTNTANQVGGDSSSLGVASNEDAAAAVGATTTTTTTTTQPIDPQPRVIATAASDSETAAAAAAPRDTAANNSSSSRHGEKPDPIELARASPRTQQPPPSLSIGRSVSEDNLASTPTKGAKEPVDIERIIQRSNSFANNTEPKIVITDSQSSGEIVLSDSNDTREKKYERSPSSSYEDQDDDDEDDSSSIGADDDDSEEDDSEVLLAKEMALAIAKNPSMTPGQLRELQDNVKQTVERRKSEKILLKASKKKKKKKSGKSKSSSHKKLKEEMRQLSDNAKEAIKKTEQNVQAHAKKIEKEFKKGLIAMGLSSSSSNKPSTSKRTLSSTSTASLDEEDSRAPLRSNNDAAACAGIDENSVRLSAIIWKRRSGFGKFSMTAPWERRRVVLKGSKLIYYKTLEDSDDDEDMSGRSTDDNYAPVQSGVASTPSGDDANWINSFIDKTGVSMPWESTSSAPGARGCLDLRKEKASAAASYGHTGAPTPFALSIKVATTTKYKFCFDNQQELMQWLAAITDVVVEGSVDAYNAEILEANDPSFHGHQLENPVNAIANTAGFHFQEASPRNAGAATSNEEGRGHQLWTTESYLVTSEDNPKRSISGPTDGEPLGDIEEEEADSRPVGASPDDYTIDTSKSKTVLAIPSRYLEPAFFLVNAVVLAARAETTLTNEMFWHVLVFVNVLAVMLVEKVPVGGSIRLKPELEGQTTTSKGIPKQGKSSKKRPHGLQTMESSDSIDGGIPASSSLVDENFVPPAGSTSMRIENPSDIPTKDGVIFAGWRRVDPSSLMVRGLGYKTNKTKVPCPNSLYECVELDVFESKKRVPDMAGRVVLPQVSFENDSGPRTWNAPDQFVITVALPTDPPKLYGGSTHNGGGYTITMYCVMRQETRDILRRITADGYNPAEDEEFRKSNKSIYNGAKLFDEWCRRAPSDDNWMARFKVVPQGNNLAEIGLPAWIANYNGKPFLIKRPGTTGFLYRHPDKSCMEFDVSLHPFPYLAKQGICYMKDGYFKKILATLAFCIEGRTDDELPECLIGLFQLCYPNPIHATQAEEFFAGKSARSK